MNDRSLVPTLNGEILQGPTGITPPIEASPQGAKDTLVAVAWKAAIHVAKNDPTTRLPKGAADQVKLLRLMWDTDRKFRLELAEMMLHILDEMDEQLGIAKPILLQWVETNGIHHYGGWDTVSAWLKGQRDRYTPAGGYWSDLGRITDHIIPFVQDNVEEVDPAVFFGPSFVSRLRPAIPAIVQTIKHPEQPLGNKIRDVKYALGIVAQAETRREVEEAFKGERRKPLVPAYIKQPRERRYLILELPHGPAGDAFVNQVKRSIGRRLEWRV